MRVGRLSCSNSISHFFKRKCVFSIFFFYIEEIGYDIEILENFPSKKICDGIKKCIDVLGDIALALLSLIFFNFN